MIVKKPKIKKHTVKKGFEMRFRFLSTLAIVIGLAVSTLAGCGGGGGSNAGDNFTVTATGR